MTMPVLVSAAQESLQTALADCAAQQLRGHRFANADPRVTERLCHELLGDHYETAVAYPRFSYLAAAERGEDGARSSGSGERPAADAKVTFGAPRSLGARFMLTVTQHRHGALLDLEWSDESGWGASAESMLLQIESLVVRAAAAR
jgi:hypothetical protein